MSLIDVRDLSQEELATGKFPVDPHSEFRLHLEPEVHRGIQEHAKADASIEICGILVGRWERDENGPYARVTDYIRCDNASSKFAEVTFTHESWAHINAEMDSRFEDSRIVGWYHSHPDFGIFLSERDCFIQEHFFGGAGQVAYVVDPIRELEGLFEWRAGKPQPMSYYWIGNEVRTVAASQQNRAAEPGLRSAAALPAAGGPVQSQPPPFSTSALLLLGSLSLLLLGYLYGGWRSRWEQDKIVEGAVAHYGVHKLMKFGLEDQLNEVHRHLQGIRQEFAKLPATSDDLTNEQQQAAAKQRKLLADNLLLTERAIGAIQQMYGHSEAERDALAKLIARKQNELRVPPSSSAKRQAESAAKPAVEKPAPATQKQETEPLIKEQQPSVNRTNPDKDQSMPPPTETNESAK